MFSLHTEPAIYSWLMLSQRFSLEFRGTALDRFNRRSNDVVLLVQQVRESYATRRVEAGLFYCYRCGRFPSIIPRPGVFFAAIL